MVVSKLEMTVWFRDPLLSLRRGLFCSRTPFAGAAMPSGYLINRDAFRYSLASARLFAFPVAVEMNILK